MRSVIFAFLVSAALLGCSSSEQIKSEIIGHWKTVADAEQLMKLGMKKEDIENSAIEFKFKEGGTLEMRAIDPAYLQSDQVAELNGVYKVEKGRLKIKLNVEEDRLKNKFKEGAWDEYWISIENNVMTLEPLIYKGKVVNKLKRIENWSLSK